MGHIYLNPHGNGTAYVDNPDPSDGEQFTIYSIPDIGYELHDILAYTSYDEPVAVRVVSPLTMTFDDYWGNLYVNIYFSPVAPPTPTGIPKWLLFKIRDGNRYVK